MDDEYDLGPLVSGPTAKIYEGPDFTRALRPRSEHLKRLPKEIRAADIVCRRARRQLVGVVLGPVDHFMVSTTEDMAEPMGEDFLVSCNCGWDHAVIGVVLQAAVANAAAAAGRRVTPIIYVDQVERLPDHKDPIR